VCLQVGLGRHHLRDPLWRTDRDHVNGNSLVDLELQQPIDYDVQHLVDILDVDGGFEVNAVRLVGPTCDFECGCTPWLGRL